MFKFIENQKLCNWKSTKLKVSIYILSILLLLFQETKSIDFSELKTKNTSFWFVKDNSIPIISLSFSLRGGSSQDPMEKKD